MMKELAQWQSNRFTHGRLGVQITYSLSQSKSLGFYFLRLLIIQNGENSNSGSKPVTSQDKGKEVESSSAPFAPYSGIGPADIFPKRINPGPGFNVPGGEVPIRDEICKHIDYNTYILRQFKNMDLDTAIKQRNNNLIFVRRLDEKLAYARDALSKVPANPNTEQEFKLRNQILSDLEVLGRDRIRADARATLINSRVEFIEKSINKD